ARAYLTQSQQRQPIWWKQRNGILVFVEAQVLEAEGKLPEALESYREVVRLPNVGEDCRQCADFYVGRLYDRMDQPDSALAAYDRAIHSTVLTQPSGARLALGPTLRRVGELYEAKGDQERARDYYSQFVALWRDADSEFQPSVQEIKSRLAKLSAEPGR
ncbi:MAG TPA: tetratricopeptide repeat protein, partial [Gemmatimonadales bacterium]|nr:tetratricopeptide repeat protein [Gemmatimonadales bacterium]